MKRKRDFGDVKNIFADLKRRIDFDKEAEEEVVLSPELDMSRLKDSSKENFYSLDEIANIRAFFGEDYDSNKKYFDHLFSVDAHTVRTEHSSEKVVALEGVALSKSEPSTSKSSAESCKVLEAWHCHDAMHQARGRVRGSHERALSKGVRPEDWSLSLANAGLGSSGVVTRGKASKNGAVGSSGSSASGRTL